MKITLSTPHNAPGCFLITAADGQSRLIQTDWDFPGVASSFGFSLVHTQAPGREFGSEDTDRPPCRHERTDGTIACRECGVQPGQFISDAADWLCNHDGATVDDPGYFATA